MTFRKNHKLGFTTNRDKPLTSNPVCIRLEEELAEKLKAVPDWQDKLRTVLPELIESWTEGCNSESRVSSPR